MMAYETPTITPTESAKFLAWYDSTIGTDREVNRNGAGVYVLCLELSETEADAVNEYFNNNTNTLEG